MNYIRTFPPITTVMGYEVYRGNLTRGEESECEICGQTQRLRTLVDDSGSTLLCIDCYREFVDRED